MISIDDREIKERVVILKNFIYYAVIFLCMIALLFLMTFTYADFRQIDTVSPTLNHLFYQFTIYSLLFGVLLEWRSLKELLFEKNIGINFLLVPCVVIGVLSFIPMYYWALWFGLGYDGWLVLSYPLRFFPLHVALTITTGVLLVRSFIKKT
jgi:hypothetical protein